MEKGGVSTAAMPVDRGFALAKIRLMRGELSSASFVMDDHLATGHGPRHPLGLRPETLASPRERSRADSDLTGDTYPDLSAAGS